MSTDALKLGEEIRLKVQGPEGEARRQLLGDFDPEVARYITEFPFGTIYARPGLDLKTRELLALVALAMKGDMTQLAIHTASALRVGVPPEQIKEAVIQTVIYGGFPTLVAAVATVMRVFKEKGVWKPSMEISDLIPKEWNLK